ncbi:CopD family protein [Belnapia sp. T6]|uniref:CopD family protein n=1 Tax=Belnapia mucosa TaxID=2804532 RepID=A0ABS1V2K3_9PROT|nr:CopD family protein [Belnapia mucosa]MBL6455893.1 CopD family protein [Belnapia mucosa]
MLGSLFYALHVLGAVLWVGGMVFAILVLRPALSVLEAPQRAALHEAVLKRFFLLIWHAMPVLLLTGYLLLFGWYGGFRGAGWHIHVMHFTALLMAGVFLTLVTGPWREFRAARARGDAAGAAVPLERIRQLVTMNLGLGLVTVAIAAWGRFGG